MTKLALLGGEKIRNKPFPGYNTIGEAEKEAVMKVLDGGKLSQFLGAFHEDFYGGKAVRALEEKWADYFGVKHAISVNSATSGLYAAVGALGIAPGDEVIVSPYSMAASATAPLIYNAIPVFADIEEDTFILDPADVEDKITEKTKAILVVDIFGHPYDQEPFRAIAEKYHLKIIEDCAQAPGALYRGQFAGTLGDVGVYSLNYHKHIHCGEGGIVVTNDDELALRLKLIRNHAEAVVENMAGVPLQNMIGFNFRMTEIEAAISFHQLDKLEGLVEKRRENVQYLEKGLEAFDFLTMPLVKSNCKHVYYLHAIKFDEEKAGFSRASFVEALKAELMPFEMRETEGVKIGEGYVKPLYEMPLFRERIAYGSGHFPFNMRSERHYDKGNCPVVERMYEKELITHEMMLPSMEKADLDDFLKAVEKVYRHRKEL